ncbi:Gti1/Pac2 family-domain-containing protein [Syncephalastrum racemosum]|uniref:Gti1/Pac2 family-domain-containing protein n=1 Tax=Syncephalastrum racemosum TaxID=13706 RepID=A0A1X2H4R6_SYNRA|nr:Gti1/Pac2 family-domain-containing protein [Syncephalastrum racemosum]
MLVTETFHGFIETTQDVLLVFEGCRRGLLPRICRRLQEKERRMIQSGSVFVFDERESGIKRWTDGRVWSPSRILGNFLIYRELDKKGPGEKRLSTSSAAGSSVVAAASGDMRQRSYSADHQGGTNVDRGRERQLVGSLSDSYKFRKDGLIKKTMSIVVNGVSQHLISYYHPQDVMHGKLRTPSSVPELASLEISPELLVKQNFRIPPMVEPTFEPTDPSMASPLTPPDSIPVGFPGKSNDPCEIKKKEKKKKRDTHGEREREEIVVLLSLPS